MICRDHMKTKIPDELSQVFSLPPLFLLPCKNMRDRTIMTLPLLQALDANLHWEGATRAVAPSEIIGNFKEGYQQHLLHRDQRSLAGTHSAQWRRNLQHIFPWKGNNIHYHGSYKGYMKHISTTSRKTNASSLFLSIVSCSCIHYRRKLISSSG
ncbi:uncharacterized protein BJX67DRAFT_235520 [Aspergillus lucknowensis]|uniref:Uncharacterized protein n=1 Tax=Aspergillus lucknowensis TaxID=176173 RepID=A0ABR4LGZ9_9EURO